MTVLAWGGFSNGRIPTSQMLEVPNFSPLSGSNASRGGGSAFMRADAARQFSGLMQAFYKARGRVLSLSEGYRSYDGQGWYYNRYMHKLPGWTLAAFPGTSIHGWGLSGDLNVNGGNPSGEDLAWLRANAHKWGIVNDVASEPWHWSYRTDLVKQTITVSKLITNPQAEADEESGLAAGGADVDRLIRNKKTGSVDWVNVATGFWWHIPESGYIGAVEEHIGSKVMDLEDNWWKFYKARCTENLDRQSDKGAEKVWNYVIDSWNGTHNAKDRLAGTDKKSGTLEASEQKELVAALVKAMPKSGDTVVNTPSSSVDISALAKAVAAELKTDIVKAIGDDLAARLKS